MNQPEYATDFTDQEILSHARYLVVIVANNGLVESLECPGIQWCVDGLHVGQTPPEVLQAVIDAAAGSQTLQLFPYVQLTDHVSADIHVLNRESGKRVVLQDVSEGHEAEHKLQQKAHQVSLLLEQQSELNLLLDQKRAEAEQASAAKSVFIASMSHEFRSPISSIMGHAEALHSNLPDAPEPAAIQRASWYLLTLVENLLEQGRTGEGERRLILSAVDVPVLLNDMRDLFGVQAKSKGLTLDVNHADNVSKVQADELRLRQVLVNLLSNAIRYTPEGGISLHCKRQDNAIEFCVTDTGKGIDEIDMERIFQPFTRVNPGGESGAGLGLTISRQLITAMNGDLSVKSKIGKGSTFSFTLPVARDNQPECTQSLEGLSVLLVEDDDDVREMYLIWLEDWGMQVRAVSGFESAVDEFNRQPADLVMSDLFLGDGNGMDLLIQLRETQPNLVTILCSGSDTIGTYCVGDGSVVNGYVSKPVSAKRLEDTFRSVLSMREKV